MAFQCEIMIRENNYLSYIIHRALQENFNVDQNGHILRLFHSDIKKLKNFKDYLFNYYSGIFYSDIKPSEYLDAKALLPCREVKIDSFSSSYSLISEGHIKINNFEGDDEDVQEIFVVERVIIQYLDGKYTGEFINGRRHGRGVFKYISSVVYIGEWVKDLRHGIGKLCNPDGSMIYFGEFKYGEKDGYGIQYEGELVEYEGEFSGGKMNGIGVLNYLNTTSPTTKILDTNREKEEETPIKMQCKIEFSGYDDEPFYSETYRGCVINNIPKGLGVRVKTGYYTYEGEFHYEPNGIGCFIYDNRDVYEGQVSRELRNGIGIYRYSHSKLRNKRCYGYWENDYKNGKNVTESRIYKVTGIYRYNELLTEDKTLYIIY